MHDICLAVCRQVIGRNRKNTVAARLNAKA
jgi:hypothetical protein